jgi:hypothetical protein
VEEQECRKEEQECRRNAGTAASPVMAVRTEVAPEACNSSPGNANLRIGTQAGHDEDSHSNSPRKYALRHALSVIPAYAAVMSPLRRYAHPRRHSCAGRNLNANFSL